MLSDMANSLVHKTEFPNMDFPVESIEDMDFYITKSIFGGKVGIYKELLDHIKINCENDITGVNSICIDADNKYNNLLNQDALECIGRNGFYVILVDYNESLSGPTFYSEIKLGE